MSESEKILYVVGIGPGKIDGMTIEAKKILDGVSVIAGYSTYVELLKPYFAKKYIQTGMMAEEKRVRSALEAASAGEKIALVSSGDSGLYGMASLALEMAADFPEVKVKIIPGVTAALSGSALLGSVLSNDFAVISLSDYLTPTSKIESRLKAAASADFPIAIYNPMSHARPDALKKACQILIDGGKSPETACAWTKNIGREGEEKDFCMLKNLGGKNLDMLTTVFVGSSATKKITLGSGENQRDFLLTPRGYMQRKIKKIILLAGTSEGKSIARSLFDSSFEVTISLATQAGLDDLREDSFDFEKNCKILTGRMNQSKMEEVFPRYDAVVDATHPYAEEVSKNALAACKKTKIPYFRFSRPESESFQSTRAADGITFVPSVAAAAELCASFPPDTVIFVSTGSRELAPFTCIENWRERVFFRVLPSVESIQKCLSASIPMNRIIAMQGPFSTSMNEALFCQTKAKVLVTKESGEAGGFAQKIEAAKKCSMSVIVVSRPQNAENAEKSENDFSSQEELVSKVREVLKS